MPHLVQMDKKLKKKGLVLILPESQQSSEESIKTILEKNDAEFTVTNGIQGPRLLNGLPHMLVFDVAGKLVFSGSPRDPDCERTIKTALKEATASEGGDSNSSSGGLPARKQALVAERAWKNAEGKAMTASLLELSGNTGKFRFPNGQQFEFDITKLCDEDQEVIKAAQGEGESE